MHFQLGALLALLKLQAGKWQTSISYQLRFVLCGIFTFLTFSIFELLQGVTVEQQNSLLIALFGEPRLLILVGYLVGFGFAGLYFSIIAAALFNSLLPKS